MCSPCRQKYLRAAVIETAIEKMREQMIKDAESAAKDQADMGWDCCDGSDHRLYEAVWRGLQDLSFIPETEKCPYDLVYSEAYTAERIRLGYEKPKPAL